MKRLRYVLVAFALQAFLIPSLTPGQRNDDLKASKLVGKVAPDFTLEGTKKDAPLKLADHAGKVILLDFWASWCPPCREELPILQELYRTYEAKGVVLIGVNVDQDRKQAEKFASDNKLSFPLGFDSEGKVGEAYGIEVLPTLFVIGKDSKVRKVHFGAAPDLKEQLKEEIDPLLLEEPQGTDDQR